MAAPLPTSTAPATAAVAACPSPPLRDRAARARQARQDKLDLQIRADSDRLAALVRTPGLQDEEVDAILTAYYERYTRHRGYLPEGVNGSFGSVLRLALQCAGTR